MFKVNQIHPRYPIALYLMGIALLLISILQFMEQATYTMFGPIGLASLVIGLAEQEKRRLKSNDLNKLHLAAMLLFVVSATFVIINTGPPFFQ